MEYEVDKACLLVRVSHELTVVAQVVVRVEDGVRALTRDVVDDLHTRARVRSVYNLKQDNEEAYGSQTLQVRLNVRPLDTRRRSHQALHEESDTEAVESSRGEVLYTM